VVLGRLPRMDSLADWRLVLVVHVRKHVSMIVDKAGTESMGCRFDT